MKKINVKKTIGIITIGTILMGALVVKVLKDYQREVIIKVDGNEIAVKTYTKDVQGVLHENNIEIYEKDKVTPNLEENLTEGEEINIKRAVNVKIVSADNEKEIKSAEDTIEDLIEMEKLDVDEDDIVYPSKETLIEDGIEIKLTKVEVKTVTDKELLAYNTVTETDSDLEKGVLKVESEGQEGEKSVTYEVSYHDGIEVSRKKVAEAVNFEPKHKLQVLGTKEKPVQKPKELVISRGGAELAYSKTFMVTTTAYSPQKDNGVAYTASGRQAVRNINGYSTVAVDPTVIPLGTKMYIEGYGLAIAADTGGAIKGNKVDVFFNTYNEAINWGLKSNKIYILK